MPKITLNTIIDPSKLSANIKTALEAIQASEIKLDFDKQIKKLNKDFSELEQILQDIKSLNGTISNLTGSEDIETVETHKKKLAELTSQYEKLYDTINKNPLKDQAFDEKKLSAFNNMVKDIGQLLKDNKSIEFDIKTDSLSGQSEQVQKLKQDFTDLKNTISDIQDLDVIIGEDNFDSIEECQAYKKELEEAAKQYETLYNVINDNPIKDQDFGTEQLSALKDTFKEIEQIFGKHSIKLNVELDTEKAVQEAEKLRTQKLKKTLTEDEFTAYKDIVLAPVKLKLEIEKADNADIEQRNKLLEDLAVAQDKASKTSKSSVLTEQQNEEVIRSRVKLARELTELKLKNKDTKTGTKDEQVKSLTQDYKELLRVIEDIKALGPVTEDADGKNKYIERGKALAEITEQYKNLYNIIENNPAKTKDFDAEKIAEFRDYVKEAGETLTQHLKDVELNIDDAKAKEDVTNLINEVQKVLDENTLKITVENDTGGTDDVLGVDPAELRKLELQLSALQNRLKTMGINWSEFRADPEYATEYKRLGDAVKEAAESLSPEKYEETKQRAAELKAEIGDLSGKISGAGQAQRSFGDVVANTGKRLAAYMVSLVGYTMILGSLRQMLKDVKEIDAAQVRLQRVTDLSGDSLERFTKRAFEAGNAIGRTGKDVLDAVTEFRRAGFELEQSMELGKAALVATNIGDGINNVAEASSALIAILRGFKIGDSDVVKVLDSINEVGLNGFFREKSLIAS